MNDHFLTMEVLQLMYQKDVNLLDFLLFFYIIYVVKQSVFLKIKDGASHALLRKFWKIQILATEGLKLSACLGKRFKS